MIENTKNIQMIYQFKIVLLDIKPLIWRSIQIPGDSSFWDLHVAIQDSMGWEDCHLNQFNIINPNTGLEDHIGLPDDEFGNKIVSESEVSISSYFSMHNIKALYEYDFGDCWEHKVVLEKILEASPNTKYPTCIDGERACPPEDCGGVPGYMDLVEAMKHPKSKEYAEYKTWLGKKFDPEKFDHKKVVFTNPKKRLEALYE